MDHPFQSNVPKQLRWFAHTDKGKVRPHNEDSFVGIKFDGRGVRLLEAAGETSAADGDFAFAVSDGLGGAKAGEFASRAAMERITALLPRSFRQAAEGLGPGFEDVLSELFDHVHNTLVNLGNAQPECHGMEATLSLCWFTPGWTYFGHIGDSRIYYAPAGLDHILQLTHDDTHVGWLLRTRQINERQARDHPRRRMLQKALGGSNQFVEPQVGAVACAPGDIFLLCTDGLTEGLYDADIAARLRANHAPDPATALVADALERDGRDNITALVIQAM